MSTDNQQEALRLLITTKLDPTNDAHWLDDGAPNPSVVYELMGSPAEIELSQVPAYVTWAAPNFNRATAEVKPKSKKPKVDTTLSTTDGVTEPTVSVDEGAIDEIDSAARALAKAQADYDAAVAKKDAEIEAQQETPVMNSILEYLERQKANLAERAEKIQFVKENSGLLKDLLKTKSPIDAAMGARKRTRQ